MSGNRVAELVKLVNTHDGVIIATVGWSDDNEPGELDVVLYVQRLMLEQDLYP